MESDAFRLVTSLKRRNVTLKRVSVHPIQMSCVFYTDRSPVYDAFTDVRDRCESKVMKTRRDRPVSSPFLHLL